MGGKGNRAVRSPGRKPADVFAGRELGEGGRARRRKRKRGRELWESKDGTYSLPNSGRGVKYWSARRTKTCGKPNLFVRIVNGS